MITLKKVELVSGGKSFKYSTKSKSDYITFIKKNVDTKLYSKQKRGNSLS